MTSTQNAALLAAMTVAEAIRDAGPSGIPSGKLYAILMSSGLSLTAFKSIIAMLKKADVITEPSPFLYVFAK